MSQYNTSIRQWAHTTASKLRSNIRRNVKNNTGLAFTLRTKTKQSYGEIDTISFQFQKHGIFLAKGVGKGYKMVNGTVIRTAASNSAIRRLPRDWFNRELDAQVPILANTVAELRADLVLNAARLNI